ncbi:protein FAF-like, chloroplastic [Zingiber officinale]|nr:protein FAF-like, chloroplastic [Zingiber officinale]
MSVVVKQISPAAACSNFGRPEDFESEERPVRSGVWSLSQSHKRKAAADGEMRAEVPYVHPLVRRSSSSLSQQSLEVCTESLGSETGSDEFSPAIDGFGLEEAEGGNNGVGDEEAVLAPVSYHGRKSPPRSFPPPLPSISQRHVPCLHMRPHRVGGRLVVEAVAVPSTNYLQAHRADGRLVISLTKASVDDSGTVDAKVEGNRVGTQDEEIVKTEDQYEEEEEAEEEEEEEEEVEVVDRGTVVEVKVSTQPQQQSGAAKTHRSSLVINKFLGGTPLSASAAANERPRGAAPMNSTAAAAAVVAASSTVSEGYNYNSGPLDGSNGGGHHHPILDNVLLFTSKRRNRDELLHSVRRCSQLRRRRLFIWEPCCFVTST